MKVSVITPTWQRQELLTTRCVPSVQGQTHREVEHIIVSDGPDPELAKWAAGAGVVYGELEDHRPELSNWGSRARNHAAQLCTGDYIAYLDDDNAYRPHHLETLASALDENPGAEFAYSRMRVHWNQDYEVGATPPTLGQIDTSLIMHRRDTLTKYGWWPVPGSIYHCPDWEMVAAWMLQGVRWVFVPEITVDYWRR